MEMRAFAERIFFGESLGDKLAGPVSGWEALSDEEPGEAMAWEAPTRRGDLAIAARDERLSFPHPQNFGDAEMAARALHTFAIHELMAVEMMAFALLAFPDAPAKFRSGLARLISDEQRHTQMYVERLSELGVRFGELPLNDHFHRCGHSLTTPLKWICAMNLTFEQANLDHAPYFADWFRKVGDEASAELLDEIYHDEIQHVGFGARWLREWSEEGSTFETYVASLTFHNEPERARGDDFDEAARKKAGLDDDFVAQMAKLQD